MIHESRLIQLFLHAHEKNISSSRITNHEEIKF